jgi:iron(III) transport system permease protein
MSDPPLLGKLARGARWPGAPGRWLGLVLAFLGVFLLCPLGLVIYTAFVNETGALTLGHFSNFFGQTLLRESFSTA